MTTEHPPTELAPITPAEEITQAEREVERLLDIAVADAIAYTATPTDEAEKAVIKAVMAANDAHKALFALYEKYPGAV